MEVGEGRREEGGGGKGRLNFSLPIEQFLTSPMDMGACKQLVAEQ